MRIVEKLLDYSRIVAHYVFMPLLNGSIVRHRLAQIADDDDGIAWLSRKTGINRGTLRNATRERGQLIGLRKVYLIAGALGLTYDDVINGSGGVPDEPPKQPKNEPARPRKREDKKGAGPKRATDEVAA